jgi:hydrophobic/amphiphilic exporter-1 (mainly G- bacteria), HAE1 family
MLVSTCIAVLFVPSFFVVLQRLSERRGRKAVASATGTIDAATVGPQTVPPEAQD